MATVNKDFRLKNGLVVGGLTTSGVVLTNSTGQISSIATLGNSYLTNSSLTVNGTSIALGSSATITANTTNSLVIKADSGTTEGTDLYTFNGSAAKTLNFIAGTGISISKASGSLTINATSAGTVTSVTGTSPVVSSGGSTPAISLASGYGDTQNPFASKTANYFLAAPNGSAGSPVFRAIVAADIPTLNQNTTGSAGSVANSLTIGTGLSGTSYNGSSAVTIAAVSGSTSVAGILQLTDSTSSTSTTTAATPNSVKTAYDLANAAVPKSGGTMTGTLTLSADPTSAMHAATKQYVDGVAQGVNAHDAVQYATTGTIAGAYTAGSAGADGGTGVGATITYTSTGTTTLDSGASPLALNDRVLVKDGITADPGTGSKANGIYYVSTAGATGVATVLTRALDYDNSIAGDIMTGDLVYVIAGSSNGGIQYLMNVSGTATTPAKGIKIDTDSITFTQFSGATSTLAGNGLVATGNTFNVVGTANRISVTSDAIDIASTYVGQSTITTLGTVATGTWNATTIGTTKGGTGLTSFTSGGAVYATSTSALTTGTLPVASGGTGITSFGTGVATALGNNTGGAGGLVTFSGAMGTPTSITLTNGTGLPVATGISGLGTGVATALAVNVGSSGAVVVNGGALGTPSGGTLTNATGLPVATGISGLGTGVATFLATPSSANLASAVTDETGTGALVFAGSPALTGTVTLNAIAGQVTASGSTTGTTALTLSTVYSSSTYTGGEFLVKAVNGSNIEIIKVLVISDGTNFYVTQYGDVSISSSLVDVDFSYSTANVDMVVTPVAGSTGTTSVKVSGTLIAA
jgi:hypothetical protein